MASEEIFIGLDQKLDKKRVVLDEPKLSKFTIGKNEISNTTSSIWYENDHGEKCRLFIETPEQFTYGINEKYPMNCKDDEKSPDKIDGYQIGFDVCSQDTLGKETKEEKRYKHNMDTLWQVVAEKADKYARSKEHKVPTKNNFKGAESLEEAFKPWCQPQNKDVKGEKVPDHSKPMKSYFKLATKGKGKTIKCITKIYGPGDKEKDVRKYVSTDQRPVRGFAKMGLNVQGVYYGSHGTNPYGGSLQIKVAEINFRPTKAETQVSSKRLLSKNTAKEESDISDEEGTEYEDPMGGEKEETKDDDFEEDEDESKKDSEDEDENPKNSKSKKKDKKDSVVKKSKSKSKSKKKHNSDDEDED